MKKRTYKYKDSIDIIDIVYSYSDLLKEAKKLASEMGKASFAEVLDDLENKRISNIQHELEAKKIKFLLGIE